MARRRRKFRFNVADLVVALSNEFGLDPWDFDRDVLRIAARAGPAAGQLANVTIHAFAVLCTANRSPEDKERIESLFVFKIPDPADPWLC